MKCQILFSGKNKKNIINLSSAENAQRVVKVKALSKTIYLHKLQHPLTSIMCSCVFRKDRKCKSETG